jgi:hypothetical protein
MSKKGIKRYSRRWWKLEQKKEEEDYQRELAQIKKWKEKQRNRPLDFDEFGPRLLGVYVDMRDYGLFGKMTLKEWIKNLNRRIRVRDKQLGHY